MSASEMPKIIRFTEKGEQKFTIKKGGVGLQVDKNEAIYLIRFLALFCGLSVLEKGVNIPFTILNANEHSTREMPLGGDDKEEHF